MSKRFGRNQRRAMRNKNRLLEARVHQLSEAVVMDRWLLDEQHEAIDRLKGEIRVAKTVLGKMNVAFSPTTVQHDNHNAQIRLPITDNASRFFDGAGVCEQIQEAVQLNVLVAKAFKDEMRRQVHCKVEMGGQVWGYSFDEMSVQFIPAEIMTQRIAESLADMIYADLRKLIK